MTRNATDHHTECSRVVSAAMYALGDQIRKEIIGPICTEFGLNFHSGMGTWCFSKDGETLHNGVWPSKEWDDEDNALDCPESWPAAYNRAAEALDERILNNPTAWWVSDWDNPAANNP